MELFSRAKPEHPAASVTVNGEPATDGGISVALESGDNEFRIAVRAKTAMSGHTR
ncbi:Protein of unknown function [Thermobacillus xylanilyticus]|uniref:Uncharacterized protein n=1 Tax=Thermobacillus xylanilyticus TaxID=76633 RepID=A0ABN7RWK1_THEXY|nr:Protein of unknown function [Thermobacillus xylanilyticus]